MRYLIILLILLTGCTTKAEVWADKKEVNYRFYQTKVEYRYGDYSEFEVYSRNKKDFLRDTKGHGLYHKREILQGKSLFVERWTSVYCKPFCRINGRIAREYTTGNGIIEFYDLKNKKTVILSPPVEIEQIKPEIYINGKLFEGGDIDEFIKKNSEYIDCIIPFERIEYDGDGVFIWY